MESKSVRGPGDDFRYEEEAYPSDRRRSAGNGDHEDSSSKAYPESWHQYSPQAWGQPEHYHGQEHSQVQKYDEHGNYIHDTSRDQLHHDDHQGSHVNPQGYFGKYSHHGHYKEHVKYDRHGQHDKYDHSQHDGSVQHESYYHNGQHSRSHAHPNRTSQRERYSSRQTTYRSNQYDSKYDATLPQQPHEPQHSREPHMRQEGSVRHERSSHYEYDANQAPSKLHRHSTTNSHRRGSTSSTSSQDLHRKIAPIYRRLSAIYWALAKRQTGLNCSEHHLDQTPETLQQMKDSQRTMIQHMVQCQKAMKQYRNDIPSLIMEECHEADLGDFLDRDDFDSVLQELAREPQTGRYSRSGQARAKDNFGETEIFAHDLMDRLHKLHLEQIIAECEHRQEQIDQIVATRWKSRADLCEQTESPPRHSISQPKDARPDDQPTQPTTSDGKHLERAESDTSKPRSKWVKRKETDRTVESESLQATDKIQAVSSQVSRRQRNVPHGEVSFFNQYEVLDRIGGGGFATVFAVNRRNTTVDSAEQDFACKATHLIADETTDMWDSHKYDAVQREIKTLTKVSDCNSCIKLIEYFEESDFSFIVLERCPIALLDSLLARENYDEFIFKQIMQSVFNALRAVHAAGIAHRDIKPENFLCAEPNRFDGLKLCDFGFAEVVEEKEVGMSPLGTPPYMSPEMYSGCGHTTQTDIWSAGILGYLLLFGEFPYRTGGKGNYGMKVAILTGTPEPPFSIINSADISGSITTETVSLIHRLLCREYTDRPTAVETLESKWFSESPTDDELSQLVNLRPVLETAKNNGNFQKGENNSTVVQEVCKLQALAGDCIKT